MFKKLNPLFVILLSITTPVDVLAEVTINGTRIVFNANDKEAAIQLKNNGKQPYLLQMWLDDGDPKSRPGEALAPFVITPPVVRIDPTRGQAVRIIATNPKLHQDRESLFWFNLLEVPPMPKEKVDAGNNLLQLAFRTRIKLFYRPANLTPEPLEAYKKLMFSREGSNLRIINNSPYHITFNTILIRNSNNSEVLAMVDKFQQRMMQPKGDMLLPLTIKKHERTKYGTVFYSVINDYGGESFNEKVLQNNQ